MSPVRAASLSRLPAVSLLVQLITELLQRVLRLAVLHLSHEILGFGTKFVKLAGVQIQQDGCET